MELNFLQRKIGPMALTGMILACMGALSIIIAALLIGFMRVSLSHTLVASGAILPCARTEQSCSLTVSFRTATGEPITFSPSSSFGGLTPGEKVTILYDPDLPQNAQVDPWRAVSGLMAFFGGTSLLLLFVGGFLFLRARNHPSAEIVHQYFTALENQDYVAAFQYLSPYMLASERMPSTQSRFVRVQEAQDRTQGKVTRHAITNIVMTSASFFSSQLAEASYTVKVMRGARVLQLHPYVVKEGEQWKILRFDSCRMNFLQR